MNRCRLCTLAMANRLSEYDTNLLHDAMGSRQDSPVAVAMAKRLRPEATT